MPIKDFIHNYPGALSYDIPRVGVYFNYIRQKFRNFLWYSLVLDWSIDLSNKSQLPAIITFNGIDVDVLQLMERENMAGVRNALVQQMRSYWKRV